jgi:hypothetical protein
LPGCSGAVLANSVAKVGSEDQTTDVERQAGNDNDDADYRRQFNGGYPSLSTFSFYQKASFHF